MMGAAGGIEDCEPVGGKLGELGLGAGGDVLVVAGTEAGGHCGEVSTMVLVPEVLQAIEEHGRSTPVLAAGGIVTGRQMAACMAMGAAGAWTGSMWLTTAEAETSPVIKEKDVQANSRQTVRSQARTGKYSRQLRSPWTDAWESEEAPTPLPMPLQSLVSEQALGKVTKLAEGGHEGARMLATSFVGQGVGLMNSIQTTRQVLDDMLMGQVPDSLRSSDSGGQLPEIFKPFRQLPELGLAALPLIRDIQIQNAIYQFVKQEYEKTRFENEKGTQVVTVLDYARPPDTRSYPRRSLMVAIAGGLSLILSCLFAFVFEALRSLTPENRAKLDAISDEL